LRELKPARIAGSAAVAARVAALEPFLAMEVMERAFALERDGARVMHLELGEPDFEPPPEAAAAAAAALGRGDARYTDSRGLPALREAIAADLHARHGVAVSPERVLVCSGTSPAMLLVFSLLVPEGGEVLMASPHYPCYPNFVRYCGGIPTGVPTRAEDGHRLDVDAVRRAVTPRTAAIIVNSPANPTGAVQSVDTLRALAATGVPLVSDEIYDGLVYDAVPNASALSVEGDTFVLDGFSKRYAMTGYRLGYAVVPERFVRPMQVMLQNLFISASPFVQAAGVAALQHGEGMRHAMRGACAARRDLLVAGLRELGFGVPRAPEGAFYVLADARRFGASSVALASALLERAHVGTAPGLDFGEVGEGMLRFCYAVSEDVIGEALERLGRVLPALEDEATASRAAAPEPA